MLSVARFKTGTGTPAVAVFASGASPGFETTLILECCFHFQKEFVTQFQTMISCIQSVALGIPGCQDSGGRRRKRRCLN
ncbi:MAG: hypothetical protein ACK50J_02860, partial [Planctomyces sp.]